MNKDNRHFKLIPFIWSNKLVLSVVTILMILFAAFIAAIPYSMSFIIDNGLKAKNISVLNIIFIVMGIFAIVIAFSQVLRDYLYLDFCSRLLKAIRGKTFSYLQRLSMCFYSKTAPGDVISRFSSDLAVIEQAFIYAPNYLVIPIFNALITVILLFNLDITLAWISMLIFPACLIGPIFLTTKASKAGYVRKKSEAVTISDVQTNVVSQSVVKALNLQGLSINFFEKNNIRLHKNMLKALFYSSLVERSGIIAAMILQVIILGIGTYMTFYGYLQIGKLVAFQGLFLGLTYSVITGSSFIPMIVQGKVGFGRVNSLLDELPIVEDIPDAKDLAPFKSEIKFENVTFGYTKAKKNLDNLSLSISKGASVAFVGPSGCGKSTILNLLMRFYDPDSGSVTIDGCDIKAVTQTSLREQLGIVLQDNILFNTTIMDNLLAAKLDATKEEVYEAARKAEIHDFIMSLPDEYRTLAGERGGQLSGGQRQRIAIARALLHGGNILILDEATSALDPVTQASINKTLTKIAKEGMTTISVTHRLESAANMDKIFVMENGKVMEQGTHNELLKLEGAYKKLWETQS